VADAHLSRVKSRDSSDKGGDGVTRYAIHSVQPHILLIFPSSDVPSTYLVPTLAYLLPGTRIPAADISPTIDRLLCGCSFPEPPNRVIAVRRSAETDHVILLLDDAHVHAITGTNQLNSLSVHRVMWDSVVDYIHK